MSYRRAQLTFIQLAFIVFSIVFAIVALGLRKSGDTVKWEMLHNSQKIYTSMLGIAPPECAHEEFAAKLTATMSGEGFSILVYEVSQTCMENYIDATPKDMFLRGIAPRDARMHAKSIASSEELKEKFTHAYLPEVFDRAQYSWSRGRASGSRKFHSGDTLAYDPETKLLVLVSWNF